VTSRPDSQRLVDETVERFGRADVLVNSAGVAPRNAPADWDWEKVWDFVMAVNMKGTFLMCRAVADQMVKQGGGSIVNLSSIYGLVGRPREIGTGLDPYVHSKGGVVQLTRDMAVHFAREGVRVNALCPGFVYTNLTKALTDQPESRKFLEEKHPMGRLGQPDEIARAALFLASDDASFVTGACLPVDGGYRPVTCRATGPAPRSVRGAARAWALTPRASARSLRCDRSPAGPRRAWKQTCATRGSCPPTPRS